MSKSYEDLSKYDFLDSIEGVPPLEEGGRPSFLSRLRLLMPGVIACIIVALAAQFVSDHYGAPVMLVALFLGMSFHFMSCEQSTKDGVQYVSRAILKAGVVLIGARIVLSDLAALGIETVVLIVSAMAMVIALSVMCARALKIDREQGLLVGGATAICGASAAIALSAVMPPSKNLEKNTLAAVVGVTAVGTVLMILYPFIIALTGVGHEDAGILIGGTIHDVSQVVGAGYSVSEETGDKAILVKLVRVCMLLPVIFLFAFMNRDKGISSSRPVFPLFIIGFMVLVVLNSLQVLPQEVITLFSDISKWFLVMAIAAIGMKTSFQVFFSLGWGPLILLAVDAVFIFLVFFTAVVLGVV